jgi:hypothetical protein
MAWFSNVPVSEPIRGNFVTDVEMGGFGWDNKLGLHIIVKEELDQTILPYRRVDPSRTKRLDR